MAFANNAKAIVKSTVKDVEVAAIIVLFEMVLVAGFLGASAFGVYLQLATFMEPSSAAFTIAGGFAAILAALVTFVKYQKKTV